MKRKPALQGWPLSKDGPDSANSGPTKPSLVHSVREWPGWGLNEKHHRAAGQAARAPSADWIMVKCPGNVFFTRSSVGGASHLHPKSPRREVVDSLASLYKQGN